ncbi:MAG TPA: hypothetical protein VLH84_02335 [Patescibacteria group bacterium]|nr:hypothetical protein [Patescibacteria group bacterium]
MTNIAEDLYSARIGRLPTLATVREHNTPDARKAASELLQAVGHASEVLGKVTTVFPLTLFPDTVTLDREKVTIAHRFFFRMAEVISISIEDILNVAADVGPFFGSLQIATRFFDEKKPYKVNYLWRSDALKIKQLLQGYVIATKKDVDLAALPTAELRDILIQLGQGQGGKKHDS